MPYFDQFFGRYFSPLFGREGITMSPMLTRPRSKGIVSLRTSDPLAAPVIDPCLLSDSEDIESLVIGESAHVNQWGSITRPKRF